MNNVDVKYTVMFIPIIFFSELKKKNLFKAIIYTWIVKSTFVKVTPRPTLKSE